MIPKIYQDLLLSEIKPANEEQEVYILKLENIGCMRSVVCYKRFMTDCNPANNSNYWSLFATKDEKAKLTELREKYKQAEKLRPWSLFVIGSVGNGKTMLASAFLNEFNRYMNNTGTYTTVADLMREYKTSNFADSVYQKFNKAELLILDEIRPETMTAYTKETVQDILNFRYESKLRTVLIANVNDSELDKIFDAHILSRLKTGLTHTMTASDMRKPYEEQQE